MTTPEDAVCLVTEFTAVDENAFGRLSGLLRETTTTVIDEPGHLTYELFVDTQSPRTLYVIETWASAADAQGHEDRVVTGGAIERVAPLLAEPLNTRRLAPVVLHQGTPSTHGDP